MNELKTINRDSVSEIIEKKSKFIGQVYYVETKLEAEELLKIAKKKYSDARHNCYAYSILENGLLITKSSDDGEPSGTAGMPILNVINENKITNVLIIVTRYFGGILLGTGGLVRAYTKAATEAINKTNIIQKELGYKIKFVTDYSKIEQLKYYLNQNLCNIIEVTYLEKIELIAEVTEKIKKDVEENKIKKDEMYKNAEILERKYIDKKTI